MGHDHPGSDAWPEWEVMHTDVLGDPDARGFSVGDGEWPLNGLVVQRHGKIYAYANLCPHRRHQLDLEPDDFLIRNGSMIRCASHGALFSPETGDCLAGPCAGIGLVVLPCWVQKNGMIRVRAPANQNEISWTGESGRKSD